MRQVVLRTPQGCGVHCDVAETLRSRLVGLIGSDRPEPGHGLLLRPCRSVHTAFMRFACDVVFLARDGRVLRVAAVTPPWRIRLAPFRTRLVLELAGGEAARLGVEAGTQLDAGDDAQLLSRGRAISRA